MNGKTLISAFIDILPPPEGIEKVIFDNLGVFGGRRSFLVTAPLDSREERLLLDFLKDRGIERKIKNEQSPDNIK